MDDHVHTLTFNTPANIPAVLTIIGTREFPISDVDMVVKRGIPIPLPGTGKLANDLHWFYDADVLIRR